ncbi:hypothetical protein NE556_10900 [[Clostridium] symbiosum]|uniref:hypothetical protein n=1 Tax=Clostridium symbiosum TaxID=1512 RepID=UPI00156D7B6B|nr:hypothetical protein [[Clostridium] symbiosum]MCQ4835720.1 hypothetical protein [[Clostridium] symbiosum]NSF83131.1 hypothetical protein [[Clostridium] symbiosum]NSI99718.1 hypothetical protein [[Clostridium] symbiosum]
MEIEVFRNLQNKYGMPDLNDLTFANTEQKCIKYNFRKEFGICGKKPYLENECQILR